MPVGFGFSAGDIAIAIGLLSKVYKGLKETGGSASEYQDVSEFLRGLILTLQHLQRLQVDCCDPSLVKAIQALSEAALKPIFELLEEIKEYDSSLRAGAAAGQFRSSFKKGQWTLRVPKKIEKLKADITVKLKPIQLLMESESLRTFDLTTRQLSVLENRLSSQALEQLNFNAGILSAIQGLQNSINSANSRVDSIHQAIASPPSAEEEQKETSISQTMEAIKGRRKSEMQLSQLQSIGHQLCAILLGLLAAFRNYTRYLCMISPQLMVFLRTFLLGLPRGARLLIRDEIRFEDVLGRHHTLPYQYFSIWDVFHSFLKHQFGNQPGEHHVIQGDFHILNSVGDKVIPKNAVKWPQFVLPGSKLVMSVVFGESRPTVVCPLCRNRLNVLRENEIKQVCSYCSWERYLSPISQQRVDDDSSIAHRSQEFLPQPGEIVNPASESFSEWSEWMWSPERQDHYCYAHNDLGRLYHKWKAAGSIIRSETWKAIEGYSFKRVHASLLSESHHVNDVIEPRYKKILALVSEYRRFYCEGRIFRVVWSKNSGDRQNPCGHTHYPCVDSSETVYTKIRTFVVIKNKGLFSLCITINTYGGMGTLKEGVIAANHAVIYAGPSCSLPPKPLPGEKLSKNPIRVELAGNSRFFEPTTRINFGVLHAVEHNLKVRNVGIVSSAHLLLLRSHLKEAMFQ